MKLITAIVNKEDAKTVNDELIKAGYAVTRLSTTGGFLLAANSTLLIGTQENKVDECIAIISAFSSQRTQLVPSGMGYGVSLGTSLPINVSVGGATIFVTDVERFVKV